MIRFNLDTKTFDRSATIPDQSSPWINLFVDADGSVFATSARPFSGSNRTVKFRFGSAAQFFDQNAPSPPLGVIRTGDNTLARVFINGVIGADGQHRGFGVLNFMARAPLAPDFDRPKGFVALTDNFRKLQRLEHDSSVRGTAGIPGLNTAIPGPLTFLRKPGGSGTLVGVLDSANRVVECTFQGTSDSCQAIHTAVPGYFDLAYDSSGGLWLTTGQSSEIHHLDAQRVVTKAVVSDSLTTVPASGLVLNNVVALPNDRALIVTNTFRLLRIERRP